MKVLLLTKYASRGPSSRYRFLQFIPAIQRAGHRVRVAPFFSNDYLDHLYSGRKVGWIYLAQRLLTRVLVCLTAKRFDLVWIEGELAPQVGHRLEALLRALLPAKRYYDYDDAIWLRYPELRRKKFPPLWANASGITVGNQFLADAIRDHQSQITVVPTCIDWSRYRNAQAGLEELIIGWIGTPNTLFYLKELEPVLVQLHKCIPFKLNVIGATWEHAELHVNQVPWSVDREVEDLSDLAIGIMPLRDDPWSQGKCGLKLIQYLACGVPAVASPVGVNVTYIKESGGGRLAASHSEWLEHLEELLSQPQLRRQLGAKGRSWVQETVSVQIQSNAILKALELTSD